MKMSMIEFKKNVDKVLPYSRTKYIEFLDGNSETSIQWYGVSYQPKEHEKKFNNVEIIEIFENLFETTILNFNNSLWIVNHDDKDLQWFPYDDNNLLDLRNLFKQNNISNSYRGALVFSEDDLLKFSRDLLLYPYEVLRQKNMLYKSLDISHSKINFIIKISGELSIDILSSDKSLLEESIRNVHSNLLKYKQYRGTTL